MSLQDDLVNATSSAPELNTSPDLALSAAQSGDPSGTAQVLAHTANTYAMDKGYGVVSQHIHSGLLPSILGSLGGALHDTFHALGTGFSFGAHLLNKPLQEVQHQYRYLSDVEARHGFGTALLEGMGLAAGGALGSFLPIPGGTVLGAEVAAEIMGHFAYQDSWERTAPGKNYVDPRTQQPVSIGRDIARTIGLKSGSVPFTAVSGIGDGISDLALDPTALAFGAVKAVRAEQIAVKGVEDLGRIYETVPRVQAGIHDMAQSNAGEIINKYRKFAGLAKELGNAHTDDDVLQVLADNLEIEKITDKRPYLMPTRTLPGRAVGAVKEAIGGVEGTNPITRRIDSMARRQTLLPSYLDPDLLKLSATKFNPEDDAAAGPVVYRTARMFFNRRISEGLASNFLNSEGAGERIATFNNMVLSGLQHMGIPADNEILRNLSAEIDERAGGITVGKGGEYGYDMAGKSLSEIQTRQLNTITAGIFSNQTGDIAIPDFHAVESLRRSLSSAQTMFGRADDFFYQHFTYPVFKRFTLLTGGFAERIAASELLTNTLRLGPLTVIKGRITQSAAEYNNYVEQIGQKATQAALDAGHEAPTPDELKNLVPAMQRAIGWTQNLLSTDPERLRVTAAMQNVNGGYQVPNALNPTHNDSPFFDSAQRTERTLQRKGAAAQPMVTSDDWGSFTKDDPGQAEAHHAAVAEARLAPLGETRVAADAYLHSMQSGASMVESTTAAHQAVMGLLRDTDPAVLAKYLRHSETTPEEWASNIVEGVKGLTHSALRDGEGGIPNLPLLRTIADPEHNPLPPLEYFKGIPDELKPAAVKGRILQPVAPPGIMEKVANAGFNKVLGPMVNWLSREPIYDAELWDQYQPFRASVANGTMEFADALHQSQVRATQNMLRFIHNPAERTQFAEAARNFMPFWFAQQQAFKRYGRLLADDPAAFRKFQLMASSLTEIGHHAQDKQGGNWFNYPGSGFLGLGVPKLLSGIGIPMTSAVPVSFVGDLTSLNTIFPGSEGVRPGLGPMVTIPLHLMESFMPESRPVVKEVIGPQSEGQALWKQIVPNTFLQRTVEAFAGQHSRSFQNAMMQTIQEMDRRGDAPPPDAGPMAQQQFIDRVKNQTRVNFVLKALIGAVTPASPQFKIGDLGLRQEMRDMVKKQGLVAGTQAFLDKHPDATPYTVFQSKANVGGAPLSATAGTEAFYNAHRAVLDQYPYAGAWLLPQSNQPFNQAIYNEQLAQGLRQHKAPDQFLKDLYIAAGNRQYFEVDLKAKNQAIADANGDKQKIAAINADFSKYVQSFGLQNPVWYDNFTSADRQHERQLAIQQLDEMAAKGVMPTGSHTEDIKGLLDDYHTFVANMPQGKDTISTQARKSEKTNFAAYLKDLAVSRPSLAPIINKVFELEVNNPFVDQTVAA